MIPTTITGLQQLNIVEEKKKNQSGYEKKRQKQHQSVGRGAHI